MKQSKRDAIDYIIKTIKEDNRLDAFEKSAMISQAPKILRKFSKIVRKKGLIKLYAMEFANQCQK